MKHLKLSICYKVSQLKLNTMALNVPYFDQHLFGSKQQKRREIGGKGGRR